ncbi:S1 family peptidase [Salinifilum ghardaiensis]
MARGSTPRRSRHVTAVLSAAAVVSGSIAAAGIAGTAHAAPEQPAAAASSAAAQAPPIVGGEPAPIAASPWVVYLSDGQGNQFCGGTLVRSNKVVTAAHCVEGESAGSVEVVSGRADKNTDAGTVSEVTSVWTHPSYRNPQAGADIAVLTLAGELRQPTLDLAAPQDEQLYAPGTPATVYGWGTTSEGGQSSDVLRSAEVPLVGDEKCGAAYGGDFDASAMVCAGLPEGGVDSCQGDSGGPLVAGDRLVGIVSWGNGCARPGSPGVYTRTAAYQQDVVAQLNA